MKYKNSKHTIIFPLVLAVGIVLGILLGQFVGRNKAETQLRTLISRTGLTSPNKLMQTCMLVENKFVDSISMDSLTELVIPLMMKELDPHSEYIPARDMQAMNESLEGEFDGIGVMFNAATDTVIVLSVIPNGPSAKAGIVAGDRIIEVNDTLVAGVKMSQDAIVKRLRGRRGTEVKLSLKRHGIDELVDICAQKGVYCIIDWHILNKNTNDPWYAMDQAKEFFDYMSKKHAGKAHVMYELCNEPNGNISWARIKSYAQEVIDVIVKNDPNSIIITGTPVWSQRVIAAADSPLDYPNSMYTLHFYADTHKEDLREHADQAIAKGCPIFVSEFGTCNSSGNGGFNPTESVKWFKWMKENNISWANWSWADKKETASILKPGSCGSDMWHRFTGSGALIHWALTNSELSGEDSIKLAAKAYEKDTYLSYIKERIDYVGECIAENPSLLEEGDVAALIDCAYRKDCEKEDPALSQEENYDRLASCIKDKKSSVNVVPQLWGVSAYPNPVSDVLTVDYVGSDYVVSLIDMKGVTVLNQECENGRSEINVSYLAPGAYLLKVESNGKYYLEKIQKN